MFKLPESIDIYQIDNIRQQLINYIEEKIKNNGKELILDAEKTEDIDAAGIQLLMAVSKTSVRENIKCKIINKNEIIKKLLLLSGVQHAREGVADE